MQAVEIFNRAKEVLIDGGGSLYTEAQAVAHLRDGELAVMSIRPDEATQQQDIQLVAGVTQTLPNGTWRMRDTLVNRGREGEPRADGDPIRLVARGPLQGLASSLNTGLNWRQQTGTVVREIMYDERNPRSFLVYPAMSDGNTYISLLVDAEPASYESATTFGSAEITVADKHAPALVEWLLYRFLSRKADLTEESGEARVHWRNFFNLLGESITPDVVAAVRNREQLR